MMPVTNTQDRGTANQIKIWKTAGLLAGITALEFMVAFLVPNSFYIAKVVTFILMTIWKAFYIVADFMHLKYEVRILILCIIIPFVVFVAWLLVALLAEGTSITDMRSSY